MKKILSTVTLFFIMASIAMAQSADAGKNTNHYFLDIHYLRPGGVTFADVEKAHRKDLAVQRQFGVNFLNYWVNEKNGVVYCLSQASDSAKVRATHAKAHGLLPNQIMNVTGGIKANEKAGMGYYLDAHFMGAGKVTAKDVAAAHQKDLASQQQHGVNFINYWVNEKTGFILCLSQAADSLDVINTHKAAHGLLPAYISSVKQGQ